METRKYYINQDDLGQALREVIERYVAGNISNKEIEKLIYEIVDLNSEKFFVGEKTIAVRVERKLGKKRLSIIKKILEKRDK